MAGNPGKKRERIQLGYKQNDLLVIQDSCISPGGLLEKSLRVLVWPVLLQVKKQADWDKVDLNNAYSDIISRDINRSLFSLDVHKGLSECQRQSKRADLSDIVNGVIVHDPSLHYFQGFHSICTVFYEVGGRDLGFLMSLRCAAGLIRDTMRESFDTGVYPEMQLIYRLLSLSDRKLSEKVQKLYTFGSELTTPMFSLPWVLTWLAHNLESFSVICRVFDFILGTHSLAPIYLTTAIILSQRSSVAKCESMPELHQYFAEALGGVDMEEVCKSAFCLMQKHEPQRLLQSSEIRFISE